MTDEIPDSVSTHPFIEKMGSNCCIDESVSIWRRDNPNTQDPLITMGDNVVLLANVRLVVSNKSECEHSGIHLGNKVIVNVGSFLSGEGGLFIEDEVLIGPHVRVLTAGHNIDMAHESIIYNALTFASVKIGKGAWLGAGSTILQGRNIGQGAVVGAGSVVTRDVPPFAVVVGNPAKIVRFRNDNNAPSKYPLINALFNKLVCWGELVNPNK